MKAKYKICEWKLNELSEKIKVLNKRAKRLGVAEIEVETKIDPKARQYEVESRDGTVWVMGEKTKGDRIKTGQVRDWYDVTVSGETPKLDGWILAAVLTPIEVDGGKTENMVSTVPGFEIPVEFRGRTGECDHCNHNRYRKETFVVKKGKDWKCVGRTCLMDFLGHKDPHAIASWCQSLAGFGEFMISLADPDEIGFGGSGERSFDLTSILSWTSSVIRNNGWVSRGKAYEEGGYSTADCVMDLLTPPPVSTDAHRKAVEENRPTDADKVLAAEAVEWAEELDGDLNDYLHNVNLVARHGSVNNKTLGVACSILPVYAREKSKIDAADLSGSDYVGTVGKREDFEVVVDRIITLPDYGYGCAGLHLMRDTDGNALLWKASANTEWLEEGNYRIKATVKDHKVYDRTDCKQTTVSRVKVSAEVA